MFMLAAADAWKRPMLYISMRSSRTMSCYQECRVDETKTVAAIFLPNLLVLFK